jgi:hypothetical protein
MKDVTKVSWNNSQDHVRFTLPISKVDVERREVSGFASLDNEDTQGDVILSSASADAFSRFRGNIREMHQPLAVGKMLSFSEEQFFDATTGKAFNGIFVTARVSKGAQDTWEKVLDGTLSGFSIGGNIIEADEKYDPEREKVVRYIKAYDLDELSLVDNPANQLANIFSITKAAGSVTATGIAVEANPEIVYFCSEDTIAKTSADSIPECPKCQTDMKEIGWIEFSNDEEKEREVAKCIDMHLNEGGADMSKKQSEDITKSEETVEEEVVDETEVLEDEKEEVAAEETEEDVVEEDNVEEVEDDSEELVKMLDEMKEEIQAGIQDNLNAINASIAKATESFDKFYTETEKKFEEYSGRYDELVEKFAGLKSELGSVEKSVNSLQRGTAMRKSEPLGRDTDDSADEESVSVWKGKFLGSDYLK